MHNLVSLAVCAVFFGLVLCTPLAAASSLSIELEVPEYTITRSGDYDYVEIPGGSILLGEEGRPKVPYYTYTMDMETGYRIQEVRLVEKSEPESRQGINLPLVILQWTLTQTVEVISGWYPTIDYEWNVINRADGNQSLNIVVYPVRYNPETDELLFYRNFSFLVDYITSAVEITELALDKPVYTPGETVNIEAAILNDGSGQDLYLDFVIRLYGSDELADSLPVRLLKDVAGSASISATWESTGTPEGSYYVEATLTDVSGNILNTIKAGFALREEGATQLTTQAITTTLTTTTHTTDGFLEWAKGSLLYIGIGTGVLGVVIIIIIAVKRKAKN